MKVQIKIQRIICITVLVSAVIAFVMALGLLTDIYYASAAESFKVKIDGVWHKMNPTTIYDDIQPFNNALVSSYITLIVLSAFLFLTLTHSRRNYYISNYVITGIVFGYGVYAIINSVMGLMTYKNRFLTETDFENYKIIADNYEKVKYTESTFWLDINIAAAMLVLVAILLLLANLIWKTILMKKEKSFLASQNIKEVEVEVSK